MERNCGPFVIEAEDINYFVGTFQASYGETFNATDIIIVSFSEKMIWVLFHEGICWLSKGESGNEYAGRLDKNKES